MSAYVQNVAYVYGTKKEDAKENTISKKKLEELEKMYGKYLTKAKDASGT